ncbi:MAG: DNA repair protein RecO [Planctomycetes bacterium]|nr:DNA repair protein RecO [Planctomycetota bacterium]
MATEKAQALVLRTTDWSETSRIATLWTREFGKVRVLAKGGRRLKSAFENALDLLTLCSIVLIRKSSGGLDLLTEAQVVQRFPRLGTHLPSLYGAYYVAELLDAWTEENDPHPGLFDLAVETLRGLGGAIQEAEPVRSGLRVMRFEMQLLCELGYCPVLEGCAGCGTARNEGAPGPALFSVAAGGLVCPACQPVQRDRQALSPAGLRALEALAQPGEAWRLAGRDDPAVDAEVRRLLGQYVTYLQGRRPRLLSYLESVDENGTGPKRERG